MKSLKNIIVIVVVSFLVMMPLMLEASVKVTNVELKKLSDKEAVLIVQYDGVMKRTPELMVRDKILQIKMPQSIVWPKLEKRTTLTKRLDTTLMAYQFNKDVVRVRALLPYPLDSSRDEINIFVKDQSVELKFPILGPGVKSAAQNKTRKNNLNAYDETYLNALIGSKEKKDKKDKKDKNVKVQKTFLDDFEPKENKIPTLKNTESDTVATTLSAVNKKKDKGEFSLTTYVGKFVAFLGLMLLFFIGITKLMKKGFFKKGKLSFLTNTDLVSVLNTTYIGPKKSLMLVRVQDQVILLGSSDQGINYITEVKDTNNILKEGDRLLNGSNFDNNLDEQESKEKPKELKLKENIYNSKKNIASVALDSFLKNDKPTKAQNKKEKSFVNEIKNKAKNLKPLQ